MYSSLNLHFEKIQQAYQPIIKDLGVELPSTMEELIKSEAVLEVCNTVIVIFTTNNYLDSDPM